MPVLRPGAVRALRSMDGLRQVEVGYLLLRS
jgi:hypothetical protein